MLKIHNNTTKSFQTFLILCSRLCHQKTRRERRFSLVRNSTTLKTKTLQFHFKSLHTPYLFWLLTYKVSCEKNDVSRVKLESIKETKSHAIFTDLTLMAFYQCKVMKIRIYLFLIQLKIFLTALKRHRIAC